MQTKLFYVCGKELQDKIATLIWNTGRLYLSNLTLNATFSCVFLTQILMNSRIITVKLVTVTNTVTVSSRHNGQFTHLLH